MVLILAGMIAIPIPSAIQHPKRIVATCLTTRAVFSLAITLYYTVLRYWGMTLMQIVRSMLVINKHKSTLLANNTFRKIREWELRENENSNEHGRILASFMVKLNILYPMKLWKTTIWSPQFVVETQFEMSLKLFEYWTPLLRKWYIEIPH